MFTKKYFMKYIFKYILFSITSTLVGGQQEYCQDCQEAGGRSEAVGPVNVRLVTLVSTAVAEVNLNVHSGLAGHNLHCLHFSLAEVAMVVPRPGTAPEHWLLTVPVAHSFEAGPHTFGTPPRPHRGVVGLWRAPLLDRYFVRLHFRLASLKNGIS